ncbi:NSP (nuclear shuttle protein)-interacting GTPase [Actinidia rufa]|uniref:NSP (Nuclear shuttle protein)-interacting GTPase n=1 Tax=Actinidia rufa TaxID=165716 RepID=A0A7J0E3Z4_9ERIC|nr:NSP (nuclear shuttle protein)-interacting GTPase [Actinidia rufa]
MAKFSSQEVSGLQGGGNASAKEVHFKEWDPQRHSVPDTSNVERLRDFIKHVYVDRRYTGERSFDKPPRTKMGEAEDSYESRRTDTYEGGSRSPPCEDTYEHRYGDKPSPGGRSDDITEIVTMKDEVQVMIKKVGSLVILGEVLLPVIEGRSPDCPKDLHVSSPTMVHPVREIWGENVSPLRIIEPPKANNGRAIDGSVCIQVRIAFPCRKLVIFTINVSSCRELHLPVAWNPPMGTDELRRESSGILIDLDAVPEPPPTAVVPQIQQTTVGQSIVQPSTSSNADNWACFDSAPEVKMSQPPANANSMESVLSQLSVPASVPAQSAGIVGISVVPATAPVANMSALSSASNSLGTPVGQMPSLLFVNNAPTVLPINNLTNSPPVSGSVAAPVEAASMSPFGIGASATLPAGGAPVGAPGSTPVLPSNRASSFVQVADGGQWLNMLPLQPSLFPDTVGQTTAQPFTPPALSKPIPEVTSGAITQLSSVEAKPSGRTALPEDLFTATYPSSAMVPGWQTGLQYGYGFNMQYNTAAPLETYPQPSKSSNPFDLNNEISPVQAPMVRYA